jgi:hypothetical protein
MIREVEITKSALQKVKAQKENFGIMDRFDVEENYMVMEALEKQIPKKPVEMKSTDKLLQEYFACPICGGWVGMDEYLNKFCAGCGQAIDWSEQLSLYEIEH